MAKKIFNLIILDASGSMSSIKEATISGLNETIQTIKDASGLSPKFGDQEHYLTLYSFNSREKKYIYDCTPVSQIRLFSERDYQPRSGTPLYDAIGNSISRLNCQVTDEDHVLVTIITDGLENNSKEYSYDMVVRLMDQMKAKGWVISYIGANQDAIRVAHSLHIDNGLEYNATPEGVEAMLAFERSARMSFYCQVDETKDKASMHRYNYFQQTTRK